MAEFKITKIGYNPVTCVPDNFIETYMPAANGDYVKVYLYLLYCVKNGKMLSISSLADYFQCTESDITRALKYWESQDLLSMEELVSMEEPNTLAQAEPAPSIPEKHGYTVAEMKAFKEQEEVRLLFMAAEAYLQKQLTRTDIETLLYFYEQLHFSTDLIEYLIQYSVSKNKKSFRYMETVALEWHKKGIKTVKEAELDSKPIAKECYQVLKALGINDHTPHPSEIAYIDRWMKEYGFTIEIILEACNRTMMQIHKPNFVYIEGILKSWKASGVHHLSDVDKLTAKHQNRSSAKPQAKQDKTFTTRFHNFEQHTYDAKELDKFFVNN